MYVDFKEEKQEWITENEGKYFRWNSLKWLTRWKGHGDYMNSKITQDESSTVFPTPFFKQYWTSKSNSGNNFLQSLTI